MKLGRSLYCPAILLLIASVTAAFARSPQKLDTIRLICLPGVPLPVVVGNMNGTFAKYGIEVQPEKASDAIQVKSDLASGKADMAHSAVENAVVMDDTGQANVVIVMGGEGSTSELIVQPTIPSVKDLRGKTVITDGPDTAYTLTLKKILLLNGLKEGADYELKVVGTSRARLNAMKENKTYAATIQKPPTSILAERAGMKSLGLTQDLMHTGSSQGIGGFVQRQWARDHANLLERYIAAFIEAQRWLMSPENKQEAINLVMKDERVPEDIAAATYETDIQNGWSKDAVFLAKGFQDDLKLKAEFDTASGGKAPSAKKYYDLSYYQKALNLANSKKR
ncbi:MAG TPA: ABC transporter substrate-binding protein [Candidatus Acidoferrales bacterium]|nr:ABC transporter substrate-binding protein [Candidatus Acidoferrales bacterium]